jgi:Cft2 family RNA processing exonuclease
MRPEEILVPTPSGVCCKRGGFHIDPTRPVEKALITHGHSDHARAGHGAVLATQETLDIMRLRYGDNFAGTTQAIRYGETITLDGARVTFRPAGHVLGSAQILVECGDLRIVASGDYKNVADPTCAPFELIPCDVFITEATFGLPVFRFGDVDAEIAKLLHSVALCPPSALQEVWSRRFPDPVSSFASGWMRVRARARQRGVELPLVISDHADWDGLTATITATGASEIWVTHGQEDALVHWCVTHGLKARPLDIVGYGDEDETDGVSENAASEPS